MSVYNISAYKFVKLEKVKTLQVLLKAFCEKHHILGTILLGDEGINMNLAAAKPDIDAFANYLHSFAVFSDVELKISASAEAPFEKLVVRIKPEIVTIRDDRAQPLQGAGQYISAQELKKWYEAKRDMIVLDTRNAFEVEFGAFDEAQHLNIENFSEFPEKIKSLPAEWRDKAIVTYCTGGIRCEKAVLVMQEEGFKNVYQLHGGILKYFEECQGDHYHGECFVFDERVSVDCHLQETGTKQCKICSNPYKTDCEHCLQQQELL